MNIEKQVVSLELAKKMKELGFPQESLFWWQLEASDFAPNHEKVVLKEHRNKIFVSHPAYTVAELSEILPPYYASHKEDNLYRCFGGERIHSETADTEADARAKTLIYLKENNLL